MNALRDHCYRLDARTWALRLVTLESFQNETRITMKTSSHTGQHKGDNYFRESQVELRKKRRFYSWITEYTQVQYTPKVARTIEAGSAEAGMELQLLQQQRYGFANPGLRDYVRTTCLTRHRWDINVFSVVAFWRANSMWGLMEAQMSLLEAWKANMLLLFLFSTWCSGVLEHYSLKVFYNHFTFEHQTGTQQQPQELPRHHQRRM